MGSTLYLPRSVANIFGNWLNGVDHRYKTFIRVGAITVIWSLWQCRNDKIFNNKNITVMQVIYRCISLLRSWVISAYGGSRSLYGDVYTGGGHGERFYYPTWVTS
jgi:hypothetical protein